MRNSKKASLLNVYRRLLTHFGPQGWWPARSRFEVIVGAILTQRTRWENVERALKELRRHKLLKPDRLGAANEAEIRRLVKGTGFAEKARGVREISRSLARDYNMNIRKFFNCTTEECRGRLLSFNGIGKETADNILLYAGDKQIFPIDAYTTRICQRLGIKERSYDELQSYFHKSLLTDLKTYKEFRALLVRLGKTYCTHKPKCMPCPLTFCPHGKRVRTTIRAQLISGPAYMDDQAPRD